MTAMTTEPKDIPEHILSAGTNALVDAAIANGNLTLDAVQRADVAMHFTPTVCVVIGETFEPIRHDAWREAAKELTEAGHHEAAAMLSAKVAVAELGDLDFNRLLEP